LFGNEEMMGWEWQIRNKKAEEGCVWKTSRGNKTGRDEKKKEEGAPHVTTRYIQA